VSARTGWAGLGSLASGALTAAALAVQTGLAAVVGVVIARDFGRTAETDGFFAAYGVFIVVVLAATAIRVAVLPPLARARADRRLGAEVAAYAVTLALLAAPLLVLAVAVADPVAWLLTGNGPAVARHTAAHALPWMMLGAVFQLYAGLAASSLAALDDYAVSAFGYAAGSVCGLGFILARVHHDGIDAVAWGMALNGAVAVGLPMIALAVRARRSAMPMAAVRPTGVSFADRIAEVGIGVALPLAMQAIYVICLPLAAREGVGSTTSFGYAYLVSAAVVAVTASSLGLVTSVPLTRAGLDAPSAARHIVSSSWLGIAAIGAVAGVFGLAGQRIVHLVLGNVYGSNVGSELGRLVVVLSVWAVMSVGVGVTFPLVFVQGAGVRRLPLIAIGAVAVHGPVALVGQTVGGLEGLALALAVTTGLAVAAMLYGLGALRRTAAGLGIAVITVALAAGVSFTLPRLIVGSAAAAGIGLVVYGLLLVLARPPGLVAAWRHLRALG
jgi:hypothetical protein